MTICAIHQPNFFPWLGYFDKIRRSDIFVFMDDVDYPKSGSGNGSWTNRVPLLIQDKKAWFGCPILSFNGKQKIKDTVSSSTIPWRTKLLKTLMHNYTKAPFYKQTMELLEPLLNNNDAYIASYNRFAIQTIADYLGLKTTFINQSDLKTKKASTLLLIEICEKVGASSYLCGGGTSGYQEDDLIQQHNIDLVYQCFTPQPYGPKNRFHPGLSVIDYLMYGQDDAF